MISESPFIIHASVSTVDEFKQRFVLGNPNLNIDACLALIDFIKTSSAQWNRYQSKSPSKPSGFIFIQNHALISHMYFDLGWCAETIIRNLNWPTHLNPDTVRRYLTSLFRARTDNELTIKKAQHYRNTGVCNSRPELWGFESEVIRLYRDGMSSERIAKEFNCSPDHIRETLKFNDAMTDSDRKYVKVHSTNIVVEKCKSRSVEEQLAITERARATRHRNGSSEKAKSKMIATIRKKYGDPNITNASQVPEVHARQQKYRYYSYTFKTGETVNIQGYERFALSLLEEIYSFSEISIRETFWYTHIDSQSKSRYFADIMIMPTQEIIEVKSIWTLQKYALKNFSILLNMLDNDRKFSFWVFDPKGNLTIIKSIDEFMYYVKPNFSHVKIHDRTSPDLTMSSEVNLK